MTVAAIRAELVDKLQTIDPIRSRSYGFAPDSLQPPTGFVGTMTRNPHATFGDDPDMTVQVWVAVSGAASSERAVDDLDAYTDGGTYDVVAALEATGTAWDSLSVTNIEFPITIAIGSGEYPAVRFDCELLL